MCISQWLRAGAAAFALVMSTAALAQQTVNQPTVTVIDLNGRLINLPKDGVLLPEFPKRDNLRRIQPPAVAAGREYYIDEQSLLMSQERIVYYTVVLRTPTGASNVFYEALDCPDRLVKSLAYGTAQGEFRRLRNRRWEGFTSEGLYGYRYVLADRYMCDVLRKALPPKKIVENLNSLDREDFSLFPERDPSD